MTFGITGADNRDQLDVRALQDVRVTKLGRLIAEIDNFQKSVLWNSLQLQDGVPPRKEPIRFFIAPGRDLFCQILISLMLTTKERASPATSLPTDRPAPGIAAGRRKLHGEEVGGARRPPIATREELRSGRDRGRASSQHRGWSNQRSRDHRSRARFDDDDYRTPPYRHGSRRRDGNDERDHRNR